MWRQALAAPECEKVLRRPARYVYSLSKAVHIMEKKKVLLHKQNFDKRMSGQQATGCCPPHCLRKSAEREAPNRQVFWLCFIARLPSQPNGQWYAKRTPHHSGGTARDLHPFPYSPTTKCGHLKGYSICAKYSTGFFLCQEWGNKKQSIENHKKTP